LRIFYKHAFFFSPHGENTILVMKNGIPERIIIKDFVEEIVLTEESKAKLPDDLTDVLREIDDELAPLFILSGIFDAVFRYLSNIFHSYVGLDEKLFWRQVAEVILDFQQENPELSPKFEKFDLFVPEFIRVCINRVRLLTHGYSESTDVPVPEPVGTLINPVTEVLKENLPA
jgi:siderophore synthetase component